MSYPPQSSYGPAYGHGAPPDYGHGHHGHDPHRSSPYSQAPPSHAPSHAPPAQYDSRGPPPDNRAPDHYHYDAHRGQPPPSSGSYQQPSAGSYQQPSSGGADPHQAHHDYYRQYGTYPPSSYSGSGHGSGSYAPPEGGSYPPPSSGGYPPPSSGYQPPSSGYAPPAGDYHASYGQHQGYPPQSGHTEPPAQQPASHYPPPANYGNYPPPAYGAPPPAYGAPPAAYGAAPPGYGAPPPAYGAPMPGYPPHPGYAAPALGYGPPTAAYFPPPGPPPGAGGRRNSPRRDGKKGARGGGGKERRPTGKAGDAKGRIQQWLHMHNDWVALWLEGIDPPSRMASAPNVTMLLVSRKGRQRNSEEFGFLSTVSRESQKKKDRERDCARDLVAVLDQLQIDDAKSWYQLPASGDGKKDVETGDLDELTKVVKRRMPQIVVELKEPESFVLAASQPFGPNEKAQGADGEMDVLDRLDTGFGELLVEARRVSGMVRKQWWVATVVAKPAEMKDDSRPFTLGVGLATDKGIAKARAVFASGKRASVLTDKMFVKEKEKATPPT